MSSTVNKQMYWKGDEERLVLPRDSEGNEWRTSWRRDYARVIHSISFRRLEGKTQLFYGPEVDGLRNRLTHSLEVAQIAKSIAQFINYTIKEFQPPQYAVEPDICEIAALVHDMGHPPFGHNGEKALDDCALKYGGFEGNAQTLRILAKLEKRRTLDDATKSAKYGVNKNGVDRRAGLNLTYRVLASCLKYDNLIPKSRSKGGVVKGYYQTESDLVSKVKHKVVGSNYDGKFKTVECMIMDVADDIAYSTYDLEDAFKSGFLNPLDLLNPADTKIDQIWDKIADADKKDFEQKDVRDVLFQTLIELFKPVQLENAAELDLNKLQNNDNIADYLVSMSAYTYNDALDLASNGYRRTSFSSTLVNQHLQGVEAEFNKDFPALSRVYLKPITRFMVEVLKQFTYVSVIDSPRLKIPEYRGYEVVKTIFDAIMNEEREGYKLLPNDYRTMYTRLQKTEERARLVVDFVSGMTDRYAIDFYNKLVSDVPQTIYGPL